MLPEIRRSWKEADPISVSRSLKIGKKPPTDISDDIKINFKDVLTVSVAEQQRPLQLVTHTANARQQIATPNKQNEQLQPY